MQTINVQGLEFFVRENTSDIKSVQEAAGGGYRRTRPFKFDVQPGELWLDFGANIGGFSKYAASHAATSVFAYEADPENYALLERNIAGMSVLPIQAAVVADERKTAVMSQNTAKGNVWRNSIERTWRGGSEVEVDCVHISEVMQAIPTSVNIKMDIEGSEMAIMEWLLSNYEAMRKVNKLVFEWSFDVDDNLDRFRAVLFGLMRTFNFVAPQKDYQGHKKWPKSWFPPCTTIFCKR